MMQIFVKTLTGTTVALEVSSSDKVGNLKAKIREKLASISSPPASSSFLIICSGKRLQDHLTLAVYDIQNESSVQHTVPLLGGGGGRTKVSFHETEDSRTRTLEVEGSLAITHIDPSIKVKDSNVRFILKRTTSNTKMRIFVETLTHKIITLQVARSDKVGDVKTKIQEEEGIPPSQHRLVYEGHELENDLNLADYDIQNESTVYLIRIFQGGGAVQRYMFMKPKIQIKAYWKLRDPLMLSTNLEESCFIKDTRIPEIESFHDTL